MEGNSKNYIDHNFEFNGHFLSLKPGRVYQRRLKVRFANEKNIDFLSKFLHFFNELFFS